MYGVVNYFYFRPSLLSEVWNLNATCCFIAVTAAIQLPQLYYPVTTAASQLLHSSPCCNTAVTAATQLPQLLPSCHSCNVIFTAIQTSCIMYSRNSKNGPSNTSMQIVHESEAFKKNIILSSNATCLFIYCFVMYDGLLTELYSTSLQGKCLQVCKKKGKRHEIRQPCYL